MRKQERKGDKNAIRKYEGRIKAEMINKRTGKKKG